MTFVFMYHLEEKEQQQQQQEQKNWVISALTSANGCLATGGFVCIRSHRMMIHLWTILWRLFIDSIMNNVMNSILKF